MNKLLIALCTILSFSLFTHNADAARRLGGGGNIGAQRNITPQPAKPPSQPQAAPAPAPAPVAAPQPSGMSRWLGPLAGLAAGAGLASLFMNNGMGGALGSLLMMVLLAAAAMFAWRMLRAKSEGGGNLQYAGATAPAPAAPAPVMSAGGGMPKIGSALGSAEEPVTVPSTNRFPPGFDAAQFARHASTNFARLQEANDKRDVSTMRDYMTPELFAAINAQIDPMGAAQHTEILSLDADVIEVVTENNRHIASVRFTGSLRDKADPQIESFDEIWHLEKPLDGSSGWLISGIQQV
jgi:predicted lipid-binding transport protein (Tim44 family)